MFSERLFDRSGWERNQAVFTVIGKLFTLLCIVFLIFTPLKWGQPVFWIGTILVVLALVGLGKSLIDFKNTPFDQPVRRGMYTISRHPQIVMSSLVILGVTIAIGSWIAVITFVIARVFSHFGILAKEEVCLKKYGEPYREYLQEVPRYFLLF